MKISDLSVEQTAILQIALEESNRGSTEPLPTPEEFAISVLTDEIDNMRINQEALSVTEKINLFRALPAKDKATVIAAIDAAVSKSKPEIAKP